MWRGVPEAPCFDLDVDDEANTTTATLYLLENGKTFGH